MIKKTRMYKVVVVTSKGLIDFSRPIKPIRTYNCTTWEEAINAVSNERQLFWSHAGIDNVQVWSDCIGKFQAYSGNIHEHILIEIIE